MKFVIAKERLYWWPVKIEVPDPDRPGKWQVMSYTHQFISIGEDEQTALRNEIDALPTAEAKNARQHDLLIASSRGWRDVVDAGGKEVEYSEEMLRQLLTETWYRVGLYNAYSASLASPEARRGN